MYSSLNEETDFRSSFVNWLSPLVVNGLRIILCCYGHCCCIYCQVLFHSVLLIHVLFDKLV